MSTFLNIEIDGRTPNRFVWKHCLFTSLWVITIGIVFFRIDILILNNSKVSIPWLEGTLPVIVFLIIGIVVLTQKWYYTLALFLYPLLALGWFIPKWVLRRGKIYLFLKYVNYIFSKFKNFKVTLIHFGLYSSSILLLLIVHESWTRWFALLAMTYLYIKYLSNHVKQSYKPATMFGSSIEKFIDELLRKGEKNESVLITTLIVTPDKEAEAVQSEIRQKNISKLVLINSALEVIVKRLNDFRGKRAHAMALTYEFCMLLFVSIIYFSFVNIQVFRIDSSNYAFTYPEPNTFDFLYYSIKTMVFSETDKLQPLTWISQSIQIFTYFSIGVFALIVLLSVFFSLRNEKINENIKMTTKLCDDQTRIVRAYVQNTYGKDIQSAAGEVKNIKESLNKLHDIINKLF